MSEAQWNDRVRVHYEGSLEDGTVFDSTHQRGPLELVLGSGTAVPGFEHAVVGMKPGEKKRVKLAPREAFGLTNRQARARLDRDNLPDGLKPHVGQRLSWTNEKGQPVQVTVTKITDNAVIIDTNHPLAGKTIFFEIELIGIVTG